VRGDVGARLALRIIAFSVAANAGLPVWGQTYTATALPGLGGTETVVTGISAAGVVVGYSCDPTFVTHAVSWSDGAVSDLGTLVGTMSRAYAVNTGGQIVGFSDTTAEAATSATVWSGATATALGTLGGNLGYAYGENDGGVVVGVSTLTATVGAEQYAHAALWSGGTATDLGTLGGVMGTARGSSATAVNDSAVIVGFSDTASSPGQQATLWNGTVAMNLGTLGGDSSAAFAINRAGLIVGYSDVSGDGALHAALWKGTAMTDLGTLGGRMSAAFGINTAGQIVGTSLTSTGSQRAVLWNGGQILDLNSLTNSGLPARVVLTVAVGINDSGQIAAYGLDTSSGATDAFLLMPTG
jgi:probable HAF family extracellular repeat protein